MGEESHGLRADKPVQNQAASSPYDANIVMEQSCYWYAQT